MLAAIVEDELSLWWCVVLELFLSVNLFFKVEVEVEVEVEAAVEDAVELAIQFTIHSLLARVVSRDDF